MAASMQSKNSKSKRRKARHMAEINVTPFVDVMLVLLIIFMVAAPLMTTGVSVDLPKSNASSLTETDDKPVQISIDKEGRVYIGDSEVTPGQMIPMIDGLTGQKRDARIYIRGDKKIDYGRVMLVMGEINRAGYNKVALVSESQ